MSNGQSVGQVVELRRFPVKSMGGDALDEAWVARHGILGDRGLALLDLETGSVVSASNKHFPGLLDWRATFLEAPRPDSQLSSVRITHPGGTGWVSDDPEIDARISDRFRRDVRLVRDRPGAYASRQAAFFASAGVEDFAPTESLVDLAPVSVVSTATLAELGRIRPQSRFDPRRFRMNIIVSSTGPGFQDNAWVGGSLLIGDQVRLRVLLPDPRCSMTTLGQDDLEKDPGILRTIAEANSVVVGSGGPQPCAGVYAAVTTPGLIRRGDPVRLISA